MDPLKARSVEVALYDSGVLRQFLADCGVDSHSACGSGPRGYTAPGGTIERGLAGARRALCQAFSG
jgi:hypothetical protein